MSSIRRPVHPGDSSQASIVQRRPAPAGAQPMMGANVQQPQQSMAGQLRRDFFVYTIFFDDLAANAAANGAIQIQSDSDFELQKLTMFADIAGAVQTASSRVLPLVTLQITDTGTGRQLFNAPVAVPALFGDGQIPFILPTTKLFSRNASVTFAVSNFSAATTYDLRLFLIGSKVFTY